MFAAKNEFFTPQQGYQISRSVRLRSSASAYFNRTPGSAGTGAGRIWTWSAWVKRGTVGSSNLISLMQGQTSGVSSDRGGFGFYAYSGSGVGSDSLTLYYGAAYANGLTTTQVFRDPSAWYHIVYAVDTTQATASNRVKLYVNGVQVTSFSASNYPTLNYQFAIGNNVAQWIGAESGTGYYFDGYLTEINFIDGQALTPTSFGQFNSVTGVWQPIKYTGTYGTNGFYLNFSDNSAATAAAIGKDYSGNGNNWTPNNISLTAGSTYDSMIDTPTPYADGGNGRGNYCVMNPNTAGIGSSLITDGNLKISSVGAKTVLGTIGVSSGKWYWEVQVISGGNYVIGIATSQANVGATLGSDAYGWAILDNGNKYNNGTTSAYFAGLSANDYVGVAFDADAGTLAFYKNGASLGTAFSGLASGPYFPAATDAVSVMQANFGQRPFAYTPPSGFVALNTQNLPAPTISNGALYMNATTYSGTTGVQAVTNSGGMQPDLVWIKVRNIVANNVLQDSVRGTTAYLQSNVTNAENTNTSYDWFRSFNSNGFTVASSTTGGTPTQEWNTSGNTYVGWQWQAGKGTTSSNTSGSITSTVSVNATAGFSIVTYTGTGANATVGHGLGVAPSMIIIKCRGSATDPSWIVGHTSIGMGSGRLILNGTEANSTAGASVLWNSTAATSTVFSLGNYSSVNQSTLTYVAYCFSAVRGYSAFGSYTGNGSSDGPFVFLGFRPRWIMVKNTSAVNQWNLWDTSRDTYNVMNDILVPSSSGAETNSYPIDILSNGFKIRGGAGLAMNDSSNVYIYAAFAENPFKLALAR